jgi:anti-sigma factor RsiW
MTCPDALELQSYCDQQLSSQRQRAVESHLAGCKACRAQVEGLRAVIEAVDRLQVETPEGALQGRLLAAVSAAPPVRRLSCRRALPQLSAYVDGELKPSQAAAVQAHIFGCDACFAAMAEMRTVSETLAAGPRPAASEQLLRRIMVALRREAAGTPARRGWVGRIAWQPLAAGAAAALILAAVALPRFAQVPTGPSPSNHGPTYASRPLTVAPEGMPAAPTGASSVAAQSVVPAAKSSVIARVERVFTPSEAEPAGVTGPVHRTPAWTPALPDQYPASPTPDGGPVVSSASDSLPGVDSIAAGRHDATVPEGGTPGLASGDAAPGRGSTLIASIPKSTPDTADRDIVSAHPQAASSGPEYAPRRSPMRPSYRSEGVDRDVLARVTERWNEGVPQLKVASYKSIPIIN